jgi:hypothetical protein
LIVHEILRWITGVTRDELRDINDDQNRRKHEATVNSQAPT